MRKLTPLLVAALCTAVVVAMSPAAANAVPPTWDHYVCYVAKDVVKPAQLPPAVGLNDQFNQGGNYASGKAKQFCTPVSKNAGPITDPITHLKRYPIKPVKPFKDLVPKGVQIDNQFGPQILKLGKPLWLMVPTSKGLGAPPPPLTGSEPSYEHYKCYKASGKALKLPVTLVDQFGNGPAVVGKPVELCNPAAKLHIGLDPIRNVDRHLVCYGIKSKLKPVLPVPVFALNQFGLEQLKLSAAKVLCVPSTKQLLP